LMTTKYSPHETASTKPIAIAPSQNLGLDNERRRCSRFLSFRPVRRTHPGKSCQTRPPSKEGS
jgi:hypothetical protein